VGGLFLFVHVFQDKEVFFTKKHYAKSNPSTFSGLGGGLLFVILPVSTYFASEGSHGRSPTSEASKGEAAPTGNPVHRRYIREY